ATPRDAAFKGASEVAMPELVASLCTLLVLSPLAMMPGMGQFLFKPMALAVAFAMIAAYILSRSFVPARCAAWLRAHETGHEQPHRRGPVGRLFGRWEAFLETCISLYVHLLNVVMQRRLVTVGVAVAAL